MKHSVITIFVLSYYYSYCCFCHIFVIQRTEQINLCQKDWRKSSILLPLKTANTETVLKRSILNSRFKTKKQTKNPESGWAAIPSTITGSDDKKRSEILIEKLRVDYAQATKANQQNLFLLVYIYILLFIVIIIIFVFWQETMEEKKVFASCWQLLIKTPELL